MEKFDCIVATHYHQDHIQGFSAAGKIEFDSFIDIYSFALFADLTMG
jgi:phosphoribosyl 1,2-cyclic phosphodiesterase